MESAGITLLQCDLLGIVSVSVIANALRLRTVKWSELRPRAVNPS